NASRSALVLRPPHRPLSDVTTMRPTFFAPSRFTRKGWRYSVLACARCEAMVRILSPYGRAWRMRSCALRIFDAATISIAFVILRVFWTLLILFRISLLPAMSSFPRRRESSLRLVSGVLLKFFDGFVELRLVVLREILRLLDAIHEVAVLRLHEL